MYKGPESWCTYAEKVTSNHMAPDRNRKGSLIPDSLPMSHCVLLKANLYFSVLGFAEYSYIIIMYILFFLTLT